MCFTTLRRRNRWGGRHRTRSERRGHLARNLVHGPVPGRDESANTHGFVHHDVTAAPFLEFERLQDPGRRLHVAQTQHGLVTLERHLLDLISAGEVTLEEAERIANVPSALNV